MKPTRDRAVLLSGGLDSAVLLATWRAQTKTAVHVAYDHPARAQELRASEALAQHMRIPLTVVHADLRADALRAGVGAAGARVVPGRNAVLIALGANVAASLGCTMLAIGATAEDARGYPDCRPDWIAKMSVAMHDAYGVWVNAPLSACTRAVVREMAAGFKIPTALTWSCYEPTPAGERCGTCNSCRQGETDAV